MKSLKYYLIKLYNPNGKIDFFFIHQKWIRFIGLYPPPDKQLQIKFIPNALIGPLQWIYRHLVSLILLQCSVLFTISAYFDIQTGTFAEVAYSLSQTVLFSFATFVVFYFQLKSDAYYKIVNFINDNFKYRSAKGMNYIGIFF